MRTISKTSAHKFAVCRGGPLRRAGFNFSEVLFAVMILGIGFIMIAAIFPVALQQTRQTGEEVVASTSARSGVNFMEQVGTAPLVTNLPTILPHTVSPYVPPKNAPTDYDLLPPAAGATSGIPVKLPGRVFSFRDDRIVDSNGAFDPVTRDRLWAQISSNLVLPSDNRLAWVCMYKRGATFTNVDIRNKPHKHSDPVFDPTDPTIRQVDVHPDGFIQVFVISVQMRNRSVYDGRDLHRYAAGVAQSGVNATNLPPATLEPRVVYVKLIEGDGTRGMATADPRDQLWFYGNVNGTGAPVDVDAADEGAFIVISDDQFQGAVSPPSATSNGRSNGRIYRLGSTLR